MSSVLVGIFVGGRSSRMGAPKGRLVGPTGAPLVAALANAARDAGFEACLVGDASAYDDLVPELSRLRDDASVEGPLAGLLALLEEASRGAEEDERVDHSRFAIAIACDMPFVDPATLRALAALPSEAPIVAARAGDDAPWEPFLARYDARVVLPVMREAVREGERSPRRVLERCAIARFEPPSPRALRDWDTPEDVVEDRGER